MANKTVDEIMDNLYELLDTDYDPSKELVDILNENLDTLKCCLKEEEVSSELQELAYNTGKSYLDFDEFESWSDKNQKEIIYTKSAIWTLEQAIARIKQEIIDEPITTLCKMLTAANIEYKFYNLKDTCPFLSGKQVIVSRNNTRLCDAILLYNGSFQDASSPLLEIMGGLTKDEMQYTNALENLSAAEVFKRFKYCYDNNTSIYRE